jgi:hypothetical protein
MIMFLIAAILMFSSLGFAVASIVCLVKKMWKESFVSIAIMWLTFYLSSHILQSLSTFMQNTYAG